MSLERWILSVSIVVVAALQYGLVIYAIRDLNRRPTVRGNNKFAWCLLILAVPFVGAFVYAVSGPTSFLPRVNRAVHRSVSTLDENDLR